MARKIKPRAPQGVRIIAHPVDSTGFATIWPDEQVWTSPDSTLVAKSGSFIRIIPPPTASDEDVERVHALIQQSNPAAVHIKPRVRPQVVLEQGEPSKFENTSIRDVVMSMAAESNTNNRTALTALCEETLAAVKL